MPSQKKEVKEYVIAGVKNTSMYGVFLKDSTEEVLNQRFTNLNLAAAALDKYLTTGVDESLPKTKTEKKEATKKTSEDK